MLYREITACRSCGSRDLKSLLDLGNLCISDFVQRGDGEDMAPLELVYCPSCELVQLRHTVHRDRLYRNYYYRSGTNESMVAALRDVVDDACRRIPLTKWDMVVDIGSNDGTLLAQYPREVYRLGFEPCSLLAIESHSKHRLDAVWAHYFPMTQRNEEIGVLDPWVTQRNHRRPKIITSIACFYDVDDPNTFVAAIKDWLHPDGIWVCQFQDLQAMLSCTGFDNICHEHLTYWGMAAFERLVTKHDLYIDDVSLNQVNGGSVRYIVKHGSRTGSRNVPEPNRHAALEMGSQLQAFAQRVEWLRADTLSLLLELKEQGKTVLGYGASTKGNTLLQYYGITPELLPAIADRNSEKWGRETAGTHIPIISEEEMRRHRPDYLFVLPWHFLEAFKERERDFLQAGGQFIVPLPELRLVGGDTCRSITAAHYAKA